MNGMKEKNNKQIKIKQDCENSMNEILTVKRAFQYLDECNFMTSTLLDSMQNKDLGLEVNQVFKSLKTIHDLRLKTEEYLRIMRKERSFINIQNRKN